MVKPRIGGRCVYNIRIIFHLGENFSANGYSVQLCKPLSLLWKVLFKWKSIRTVYERVCMVDKYLKTAKHLLRNFYIMKAGSTFLEKNRPNLFRKESATSPNFFWPFDHRIDRLDGMI
jgi:hypothetical protein